MDDRKNLPDHDTLSAANSQQPKTRFRKFTEKKLLYLSRREWLMLMAIIAVLEAWVLNVSYVFQTEQAVINYVSFAATIASLLLAVIAIIYGYYQSDGQQKSAAAIAYQIDSMRSVQKELNGASSGIADQLAGMASTAADLKHLSDSLDGTHKTLGEIGGNISGLVLEQRALKDIVESMKLKNEAPVGNPEKVQLRELDIKKYAVNRLFFASSFDFDLLGFALHKLVEKSEGHGSSWLDFIDEHYVKPLAETEKPANTLRPMGVTGMLISRSFGLLTIGTGNDRSFQINEGIYDELHAVAADVMASKHTKDRAALIAGTFD